LRYLYNYFYTIFFLIIDRGVLEVLGPTGLSQLFVAAFYRISDFSTGYLYHYAFYMTVGLTFLFFFVVLFVLNCNFEYIFLFASLFIIFIL